MPIRDGEAIAISDEEQAEPGRPFWVELPGLLFTALVVAVLVKTFLVQPFYIPTESMVPTIEVGDRVMANKLAYQLGEPQRHDIVVIVNPNLTDDELEETFGEAVVRSVLEAVGIRTRGLDDLIKRVVATGGESVSISDGTLQIDGEPIAESFLPPGTPMRDFGPVEVPQGHVFLMGDNRGSSLDSRVFGTIPVEEIIGQAVFRIWPFDRVGVLR